MEKRRIMKIIKMLLMRNAAKIVLACSAKSIFSVCSGLRAYEPKVSDELKDEIRAACKKL